MKNIKCNKCNGTGKIEVFKYIQNGICFECGGCGKLEVNDDYVSLSEWKVKIEKTEKEYLEIHNKYLEFKNRSSWDRRWEHKWDHAEISQYNTYEERKEILSAFEQFEKERKDIIIKSMTDNSIDMFDEIEKLSNKYFEIAIGNGCKKSDEILRDYYRDEFEREIEGEEEEEEIHE